MSISGASHGGESAGLDAKSGCPVVNCRAKLFCAVPMVPLVLWSRHNAVLERDVFMRAAIVRRRNGQVKVFGRPGGGELTGLVTRWSAHALSEASLLSLRSAPSEK